MKCHDKTSFTVIVSGYTDNDPQVLQRPLTSKKYTSLTCEFVECSLGAGVLYVILCPIQTVVAGGAGLVAVGGAVGDAVVACGTRLTGCLGVLVLEGKVKVNLTFTFNQTCSEGF